MPARRRSSVTLRGGAGPVASTMTRTGVAEGTSASRAAVRISKTIAVPAGKSAIHVRSPHTGRFGGTSQPSVTS